MGPLIGKKDDRRIGKQLVMRDEEFDSDIAHTNDEVEALGPVFQLQEVAKRVRVARLGEPRDVDELGVVVQSLVETPVDQLGQQSFADDRELLIPSRRVQHEYPFLAVVGCDRCVSPADKRERDDEEQPSRTLWTSG